MSSPPPHPESTPDPYYLNIDGEEGYVLLTTTDEATRREFAGNELTAHAPGTFDPRTLRLTLNDPALLTRLGFAPLPVERMGLQRDGWRRSLPSRD